MRDPRFAKRSYCRWKAACAAFSCSFFLHSKAASSSHWLIACSNHVWYCASRRVRVRGILRTLRPFIERDYFKSVDVFYARIFTDVRRRGFSRGLPTGLPASIASGRGGLHARIAHTVARRARFAFLWYSVNLSKTSLPVFLEAVLLIFLKMLNINYMKMHILAVYDENAPVSPSQEEEDETVEVCLFPFH